MIQGKKHIIEDVGYIFFKKHYCPYCKQKLKTSTIKKIINYNDSDAKDYDFWIGSTGNRHLVTGNMEFHIKGFKCSKCNKFFGVDEIKKFEGDYADSTKEDDIADKKWNHKVGLIFLVVFVASYIIYYLVKFVFKFI